MVRSQNKDAMLLIMDLWTNWLQLQMSKDVMLNGKIKVTIVNLFTTVVTRGKYNNSYTMVIGVVYITI